jgi:hypothetical protein
MRNPHQPQAAAAVQQQLLPHPVVDHLREGWVEVCSTVFGAVALGCPVFSCTVGESWRVGVGGRRLLRLLPEGSA